MLQIGFFMLTEAFGARYETSPEIDGIHENWVSLFRYWKTKAFSKFLYLQFKPTLSAVWDEDVYTAKKIHQMYQDIFLFGLQHLCQL